MTITHLFCYGPIHTLLRADMLGKGFHRGLSSLLITLLNVNLQSPFLISNLRYPKNSIQTILHLTFNIIRIFRSSLQTMPNLLSSRETGYPTWHIPRTLILCGTLNPNPDWKMTPNCIQHANQIQSMELNQNNTNNTAPCAKDCVIMVGYLRESTTSGNCRLLVAVGSDKVA